MKFLENRIPILRAMVESREIASKFAKLNSDSTGKTPFTPPKFQKTQGVFLSSDQALPVDQGSQGQLNPSPIVQNNPCPVKCSPGARHAWGCAEFCPTFKAKPLHIGRAIVKKTPLCLNCLKNISHSPQKPRRAKPCPKCGDPHHIIMCPE